MSASAGSIGVDLGSSRLVVAAAKRGHVEVLPNEANYRHTPCLVTYGGERAVGDTAQNVLKRELANSVPMPTRLLGELSAESFERETFFQYARVQCTADGKAVVAVRSGEATLELLAEQAVAVLFTELRQILALNETGCSTLVVAVPAHYGPLERQAVRDAAHIAGLEIALLISESSAVLLSYGIFRKAELQAETGRVVLFADVGHSKTSVFAARVFRDSAELLFERCDENLGVRELDRAMFAFYAERVMERFGRNIAEFPKAKLRLLEAIERQRKILTVNAEATLTIDCLIDDNDFSLTLKREEFVAVCASALARFGQFFAAARDGLGELRRELHSVEKVGGGSRIPAIDRLLHDAFNVECVGRTLDADECIARGAAIRAAMLSPLFRVASYAVKDRLACDLRARMQYVGDSAPKDALLFARGAEAGKVLSVTLAKEQRMHFQLYRSVGRERVLLSGEVERGAARGEAKLFFALDQSLFPRVERAEAIDGGAAAALPFNATSHYGISRDALDGFAALERRFVARAESLAETQRAKYALEAFVYDTRAALENGTLTLTSERAAMFAALDETANWLYGEGETAESPALNERLEALRGVCRALLARKAALAELAHFLAETRERAARVSATFAAADAQSAARAAGEAELLGAESRMRALDALLEADAQRIDAVDRGAEMREVSAAVGRAEESAKVVLREREESEKAAKEEIKESESEKEKLL